MGNRLHGKVQAVEMARLAAGKYPGALTATAIGANSEVGTSYESLWDMGGNYMYPSVPMTLYLSSSNASDTQEYELEGLSAEGDAQTLSKQAEGRDKVEVPGTWLRLFAVCNNGSTDNAGTVYVYEDDTVVTGVPQTMAKIRAGIMPGNNHTLMCLATIPRGFTGYLMSVSVAMASLADKTGNFQVKVRKRLGVFQAKLQHAVNSNYVVHRVFNMLELPELSDIELKAKVSATSADVSGSMDLLLVPV